MFRSDKGACSSNKGDITQEFVQSAISFQNAIKKSGISTWHDHIPELQMLVTFTLQLKFYPNQIMIDPEKTLVDVTEWCNKVGMYFLSNKDLKNAEQIQYSLTHLLEMTNLVSVYFKDRDLLISYNKKSRINSDKYQAFSSSSEAVPATILPREKENFFSGLLKKCMCSE